MEGFGSGFVQRITDPDSLGQKLMDPDPDQEETYCRYLVPNMLKSI
jgi:hypothetical protein